MKRFIIASICAMAALLCGDPAFSAGLPPTGQTKCYNNTAAIDCPTSGQEFYGQDAQYPSENNPEPRFEVIANGLAVKDNATELTWEIKTSENLAGRYSIKPDTDPDKPDKPVKLLPDDYINNDIDGLNKSNFAGISTWRLPTVDELSSIVNLGAKIPAIYSEFAPVNTDYSYWTGTTYKGEYGASSAWTVNFNIGEVGTNNKTGAIYVRAVSGSETPARSFKPDNADTVKDINTGLIWQKTPSAVKMTWKDALAYCESLTPGGWRLPNREELRSIVNYAIFPAINSNFNVLLGKYWSSTTNDKSAAQAWNVDFTGDLYSDGTVTTAGKTTLYYVRAVRGKSLDPPAFSLGDINHDTKVDLADVIDGLRVLDGISVTVYTDTEVNGDGKIGYEEVIYALQVAAGLRTQ